MHQLLRLNDDEDSFSSLFQACLVNHNILEQLLLLLNRNNHHQITDDPNADVGRHSHTHHHQQPSNEDADEAEKKDRPDPNIEKRRAGISFSL